MFFVRDLASEEARTSPAGSVMVAVTQTSMLTSCWRAEANNVVV